MTAWLIVIDPGHIQVLCDSEAKKRIDLQAIEAADILSITSRGERLKLTAIRLRVFRSDIDNNQRLGIPHDVFELCEEYMDRSCVWVKESGERLDIYTATYVQNSYAITLPEMSEEPESAE
jgi:hypothetical protein